MPVLIVSVAALCFLVYKKWDWITSHFTTSQQKVDQLAEQISEPVSHTLRPFLVDETPEEKEFYQSEQQTTQYQARINQLENELQEKQAKINQLEAENEWEKDNRSDYSETEFTHLRKDLTEQQQKLTEQLNDIKENLAKNQAEQEKFPEQVKNSVRAKTEQVKNTVHSGVKYFLYFLIFLVLIFIWKTIRWIFSWIFGWARTTHQQTLTQIQERVNAMAQELEAERIYQAAQRIKRENQKLKEPNQEAIVITKTETKNEPLVIKLEQPSTERKSPTPDQRKRDRANAKRWARYQLKKLANKLSKKR